MKKIVLLLTCLILGTGFVIADNDVIKKLKGAEKSVRAGKHEKALKMYQKAIAENPESVEAHRAYQNLMQKLDRGVELKKEYQIRLDKEPKKAIWHYLYGRLLEGEVLEKGFNKAIELEPKFFWVYYGLGNYYKDQKKWNKAFRSFQKAIKIKPDFARAFHGLALVYYYQGGLVAAEETWQKAEKLAPDDLEIKLGLGLCYKAQEKYNTAIKSLKAALKQDKNYWKAYEPLIQCYHTKKDYKRGEGLRKKVRALYKKTKDKGFLKQEEIVIDVVKLDKGVMVVSENLSAKGKVINFKIYHKTLNQKEPDKIIRFDIIASDYKEALTNVKSMLAKERK